MKKLIGVMLIIFLATFMYGCSTDDSNKNMIKQDDTITVNGESQNYEEQQDNTSDIEEKNKIYVKELRKEKIKKYYYGTDICSLYVNEENSVYGWGILKNRTTTTSPTQFKGISNPRDIEVLSSYKVKALGYGYGYRTDEEYTDILIVNNDGTVWTMGDNRNGIFGNGNNKPQYELLQIENISGIKDVTITTKGGLNSTLNNDTVVFALKEDKTLLWWGGQKTEDEFNTPKQIKGLTDIEKIWGYENALYAMTNNQQLYYINTSNINKKKLDMEKVVQSKNIINISSNIEDIKFDKDNKIIILLDNRGKVYNIPCDYLSNNSKDEEVTLENFYTGIDNAVEIINNERAILALKNDGTVWGLGKNVDYIFTGEYELLEEFENPVKLPLNNIIDLIKGHNQFFAIDKAGNLLAWGEKNEYIINENSQQKDCSHNKFPFKVKGIDNVVDFYAGFEVYIGSNSQFETFQWSSEILGYSNIPYYNYLKSMIPVKRSFILNKYDFNKVENYMWVDDINSIKDAIYNSGANKKVVCSIVETNEEDLQLTTFNYKYKLMFEVELSKDISELNLQKIIECLKNINESDNFARSIGNNPYMIEIDIVDKINADKKIIIQQVFLNESDENTNEFENYIQYKVIGYDLMPGTLIDEEIHTIKSWNEAAKYFKQYTGKELNSNKSKEYFKKYDDYYYRLYDNSNNEYIINCENSKIYKKVSNEYDYALVPKVDEQEAKVYEVSNMKELILALGDNRTIKVLPGEYGSYTNYDYYEYIDIYPKGKWEKLHDYFYIQGDEGGAIAGVENVTIEGVPDKDGEQLDFISTSTYLSVLELVNCSNIQIKNLNMGHKETSEGCSGSVVILNECSNIEFDNTTLFGCGLNGLVAYNCKDLKIKNSTIRDCTYYVIRLSQCEDVVIENTIIKNDYCSILSTENKNIIIKDSKILGEHEFPLIDDSYYEWYIYYDDDYLMAYDCWGNKSIVFSNWIDEYNDITYNNVEVSVAKLENVQNEINKNLRKSSIARLMESHVIKESNGYALSIKYLINDNIEYKVSNIIKLLNEISQSINNQELKFTEKIYITIGNENYEDTVVNINFQNYNELLNWINNGSNKEDILDYGDIKLTGKDIEVNNFFETDIDLISHTYFKPLFEEHILGYKNEEDKYSYGKEQIVMFKGTSYYNGNIWYYHDVIQEIPTEGDYMEYLDFAKIKVNASSGQFYVLDYENGKNKATLVSDEIKELFYNREDIDIMEDLSMFIQVAEDEKEKIILVSLHNEEVYYNDYTILNHRKELYKLIDTNGEITIEKLEVTTE